MASASDKEKEKEDADQRAKILSLQSENSRKREELARLKEKKKALDDELNARRSDQDTLLEDISREAFKQNSIQGENRHDNRQDEAIGRFIENEVRNLLSVRVPAFKVDDKTEEESDDEQGDGEDAADDSKTKSVHESCVVTYLAPNPQEREKLDEYRVTYRIDKETTGRKLHEDACEFWGCSKDEFRLCKPDTGNPVELTPAEYDKVVCDETILRPTHRAHLLLCHEKILKERDDLLKKSTLDIEEIIKKQQGHEVDDAALTTFKHGGKGKEQQEEDHFATAFQKWPGVYDLLKYNPRYPVIKNWQRVKFRDIVVYFLLCLLTGVSFFIRYETEYYWLRNGVVHTMCVGVAGEMTKDVDGQFIGVPGRSSSDIRDIKQYDHIWPWVSGSFHYQIFNENSTLRQFYDPVGILRVRQQKSKKLTRCRRDEINKEGRGGDCHSITAEGESQEKASLIVQASSWINTTVSYEDSGRLPIPDPTIWTDKGEYSSELTGYFQSNYDGSGYMVDYNLTNVNSGQTFLNDMSILRRFWLSEHTRLLTFEVLLANYNMGGFVSASFMAELSPSGSVQLTPVLLPLNIGKNTNGGSMGLLLDVVRIALIFYVLTVQVVAETGFKATIGQSGLSYVFSFTGFLDASTVATFVAMTHMRFKHDPPDPQLMTEFYSYSFDGTTHERLFCTEGLFMFMLSLRFCTIMKLSPTIDQYWKMVHRACMMIFYWLFIFLPLFLSLAVMAHCIWSSQVYHFSTFWETVISLVFFVKQDFQVEKLFEANKTWTVAFCIYFKLLVGLFLMNGFLALTVHAYYQVQLTDTLARDPKPWSRDQWADWILAAPVYRCIMRKPPGASKRDGEGDEEGGEEGDEDDDDDDDKDD